MDESEKVDVHYGALDSIVGELRLAGAAQADETELHTAVLLASMPVSFGQAVTAILMSCKTPTFETV